MNTLEELLEQANPVLDPEELRLSAAEVEARCASIVERRGVMQTQTPTRAPAGIPGPPRWRKPAFAFIISLLVVLIGAGGVVLLIGGGDSEVVDEPTVTTARTTTPTTVPEGVPDGVITAPAYADVPQFSGVVDYYEHDPALGDPGWQATVAVERAGPMRYEAEVLSGGPPYLGEVGTVFLGDGTGTWLREASTEEYWPISDFDHFGHLYYDAPVYYTWSEICAEGTVLGTESLLGRTATRVSCSTELEDYELWVDEETGIVLKLAGPLGIGDFSPLADRDGGFVFTELTLGPVTIREAPELEPVVPGEFPPFHMVRNQWPGVVEYWYRDAETLRETFIDAEDEGFIGTYTLLADGKLGGCLTHPSEQYCWSPEEVELAVGLVFSQVPLVVVEESCPEVGEALVAGRSTRHFACDGVEITFAGGGFYALDNPGVTSEYWYDLESGLLLRSQGTDQDVEATLLELNPIFPEGIFEYEEIVAPPVEDIIQIGDVAPLWSGPLVGGGDFDLAKVRGSHVVVYNWLVGYGSSQLHGLDLMQRMYDKYGDALEFVTVHEDSEPETVRILERRANTVPAVYCIAASGTDHDPACTTPEPIEDPWLASPWFLWGNNVPSTTVLDETGTVVAIYTGPIEYEAELDALLAQIAAAAS